MSLIKVMFDRDLTELYRTEIKALNKRVNISNDFNAQQQCFIIYESTKMFKQMDSI